MRRFHGHHRHLLLASTILILELVVRSKFPAPRIHSILFRVSASRLPHSPRARRSRSQARQNPVQIRAVKLTAFFSVPAAWVIHYQGMAATTRGAAAASLQHLSGSFLSAMAAAGRNAGVLALFDVDGTLTAPRKVPLLSACPPGLFFLLLRLLIFFAWSVGDAGDAGVHEAAAPGEDNTFLLLLLLLLLWRITVVSF
jgi:hypothetical protein